MDTITLSSSASPLSRFGINPGPLKMVKRRTFATEREAAESVRCKATTKADTRCERTQEPDSDYCWQHQA